MIKIATTFSQKVYNEYIKYNIIGTQPSGKMNTSQGNTLRALMYIRYAMHKINMTEGIDYFVEACGDDTIIFINKVDKERVKASLYEYVYTKEEYNTPFIHGLGQVCRVIEEHDDITGAEYLSCVLLKVGNKHIAMVRKPDRLIQLTSFTMNNPFKTAKNYNKRLNLNKGLCKGEGENILSQCHNIYLYKSIAKNLLRHGNVKYAVYKDINSHNSKTDRRNLDVNKTFEKYMLYKYGVTKTMIRSFCEKLDKAGIYDVINDEMVDRIYSNGQVMSGTNFNNEIDSVCKPINKMW